MKRVLQQIGLAVVFGLGLPGLIFGVMLSVRNKEPALPVEAQETTAWVAPIGAEKEEAHAEPPLNT